jgi:LysM repeat protein
MSKKLLFVLTFIFVSTLAMAATTYTMRKGDNLSTVAQKYGVSVSDIIKANNIKNPNKVNVGTKLVIPPKTKKYTVQKGDTLTGIAKKFGTTVAALKSTNNIKDTDKLYIGKVLVIPGGSTSNTNIKPAVNTAQKPAPKPSTKPATSSKPATQAQKTTPVNEKAPYFWPAEGPREPLTGKLKGTMISADKNAVIHSVSTGTVKYVGQYRGMGQVILVENNSGYIYIYGGNEDTMVNIGDKVSPGTELGIPLANMETGKSIVYFCVWKDGNPVDERKAPRT